MKIISGKSSSGKTRKIIELATEASKEHKVLLLTNDILNPHMLNLMGEHKNLVIINVDNRKESIISNLFAREKINNVYLDLDNATLEWLNLLIATEDFLGIQICTTLQCNPTVKVKDVRVSEAFGFLDSADMFGLVVPE